VILLDTNALIWLDRDHPRARPLLRVPRLLISPATLFELQLLEEIGRIRLTGGVHGLVNSDRWHIDEPSPAEWFVRAAEESWTRDPFDRLIVAQAIVHGMSILTPDPLIAQYPARVIW